MNCKKSLKYIYLFKEGELTEKEKKQLEHHLKSCSACAANFDGMADFRNLLSFQEESDEKLKDSQKLTDSILNAISENSKNHPGKLLRISSSPFYRIAASILIIFQLTLFLYQQYSISKSIDKLSDRLIIQTSRNKNQSDTGNQECIEQSKIILTNLFGTVDHGLKRKAIAYSRRLSKKEIEGYAVQLCQYSSGIKSAGASLKNKKLLINLINNELNIKL